VHYILVLKYYPLAAQITTAIIVREEIKGLLENYFRSKILSTEQAIQR
jgi:hypothetical protein